MIRIMIWRPLAPKGHLTDYRALLWCLVRAGLRPALFCWHLVWCLWTCLSITSWLATCQLRGMLDKERPGKSTNKAERQICGESLHLCISMIGPVFLHLNISNLSLAILNGCKSLTLARQLWKKGVSFVIGWPEMVSDEVALVFGIAFVKECIATLDVEMAFQKAVSVVGSFEWRCNHWRVDAQSDHIWIRFHLSAFLLVRVLHWTHPKTTCCPDSIQTSSWIDAQLLNVNFQHQTSNVQTSTLIVGVSNLKNQFSTFDFQISNFSTQSSSIDIQLPNMNF